MKRLAGAVAVAILIAVGGYGLLREPMDLSAPNTQGTTMERDSMPYVGVGCIVMHDGRMLLVRNQRDRWSTPGGLLEYGKSPANAAARETLEETGVTVRNVEFVAVTNDVIEDIGRHYVTIWMRCEADDSTIVTDPVEIREAGWFEPTDLPDPKHLFFENLLSGKTLPAHPNNIPFLADLPR